jgi:hypothetical protein
MTENNNREMINGVIFPPMTRGERLIFPIFCCVVIPIWITTRIVRRIYKKIKKGVRRACSFVQSLL